MIYKKLIIILKLFINKINNYLILVKKKETAYLINKNYKIIQCMQYA